MALEYVIFFAGHYCYFGIAILIPGLRNLSCISRVPSPCLPGVPRFCFPCEQASIWVVRQPGSDQVIQVIMRLRWFHSDSLASHEKILLPKFHLPFAFSRTATWVGVLKIEAIATICVEVIRLAIARPFGESTCSLIKEL